MHLLHIKIYPFIHSLLFPLSIYETLLQDLVGMFHLSLVLMFWSFASLLSSSIYRTPPYPFSLWEWIALFLFLNFILFLNFTILYWFCQILKWIRHRYICVPHPEPSSFLHPCTIPLGRSSAPAQESSIVHWTWAGDSFHTWYYTRFNVILPNLPTLSFSHRVQKTVLYISVSFAISYTGLLLPSF